MIPLPHHPTIHVSGLALRSPVSSSSATVISSRISCSSPLRITRIARLLAKKKPHRRWVRLHHHAHWMDRHWCPSAAFPTLVLSSSGSKGPKDALALRKPLPQRLQALMVPHGRRRPLRALIYSIRGAKRESRQISPSCQAKVVRQKRCHDPPRQQPAILLS